MGYSQELQADSRHSLGLSPEEATLTGYTSASSLAWSGGDPRLVVLGGLSKSTLIPSFILEITNLVGIG